MVYVGRILGLTTLVLACAHRDVPSGPSAAPSSNVYVRNAFDTDPSVYIGRFVPQTDDDVDESSAMPLTCSQHVKYRFIEGGGVKMTETMNVSTEIAVRIGVPNVADAKGSTERRKQVKVEYTLLGKMVAEIPDPAAFEACCESSPDQCGDRFIGEFLQGTGTVYREDSRSVDVGASGTHPSGVQGEGGISHDKSWAQAIEFPNPVYFAFKVTKTPNRRTTSSCGAWVDAPPVEPGYVYFVGSSRAAKAERKAREGAARNARFKAFKSKATATKTNVLGQRESASDDAQRWAAGMEIVESCVELERDGKDERYVGRSLGRLPEWNVY